MMNNLNWYHSLNLPFLTPPDEIFTPVWIVMYVILFLSFVIFLMTKSFYNKTYAVINFLLQLTANLLWGLVFFTYKSILGGLLLVIIMWILTRIIMFQFHKISKISAYLLIPYLLWISFALYLNLSIFVLN